MDFYNVEKLKEKKLEQQRKKAGKKGKKGKKGKGKLGLFAKSCTDLKYNDKKFLLTGNCKNKAKKVKASLDLKNCIANNNGKLVHGKGFNKSSKQCKLAKSVLTCQAKDKKGKF